MRSRPGGVPLRDRLVFSGSAEPAATPDGGEAGAGPLLSGSACWIHPGLPMTAGVVLAWQQQPDGQWYALVSAWLPGASVTPRQQDDRPVPPASSPR